MSLFQSRDTGDVIAEIKMNMTSFNGGYLLVEGPSDSRFFSNKISKQHCQIVICGAKRTVLLTSATANASTGSNTLGIVDDDLDMLLNVNHGIADLVSTETHDIETLLLSSPAFDRVIHEHASAIKIQALALIEQKPLVESLIDRARPFAKLRYLNITSNLNVNFEKDFSPWKFINHTTWALDLNGLFQQFSISSGWSLTTLQAAYDAIPLFPDWNLCQGHDAVSILSIAFHQTIRDVHGLSAEEICKALRLAYDPIVFSQTLLFQNMQAWEVARAQRVLV